MSEENKEKIVSEDEEIREEEMAEKEKPEEGTEAEQDPQVTAEEKMADEKKEEKEKSKLFRNTRAEKAEKELKAKEEQLAVLNDRLQRQMAEFDNFRKRTEKEKAAQFDMGARDVILKILPIVDSFERGLEGLSGEQQADPVAAGMDKVYRQLLKQLDEMKVEPIEALGKTFDANLHYAVMHEEVEGEAENVVTAVLQKGYTYKGTVIRYSMVKVAN